MVCSGILRLEQDRVEGLEQRKSIVNAKASPFTQKAVMEGKWREKKATVRATSRGLTCTPFQK